MLTLALVARAVAVMAGTLNLSLPRLPLELLTLEEVLVAVALSHIVQTVALA
jgi:hypothetical protein